MAVGTEHSKAYMGWGKGSFSKYSHSYSVQSLDLRQRDQMGGSHSIPGLKRCEYELGV